MGNIDYSRINHKKVESKIDETADEPSIHLIGSTVLMDRVVCFGVYSHFFWVIYHIAKHTVADSLRWYHLSNVAETLSLLLAGVVPMAWGIPGKGRFDFGIGIFAGGIFYACMVWLDGTL